MNIGIVLAFAPFVMFAVADRFVSAAIALSAGAIVAIALVARGVLVQKDAPRILEAGSAVLFLALAIYAWVASPAWTVFQVRLIADIGLLAIILISMAVRQPFTIQYARARVAREYWNSPRFLRVNYTITAAWAIAFAVIVIVDYVMTLLPNARQSIAFIIIVAAIYVAYKFSVWYPRQLAERPQS